MNERIIELANEANKDIGHVFKIEEAKQLHELMEKFAELIVQECVERCEKIGFRWPIIDTTHASGTKVGAFECAEDLKKHFGAK